MNTENTPTDVKEVNDKPRAKGFKKWLKRFGVVGFWFFFIKGMLWVVVAVAAYYGFKLF